MNTGAMAIPGDKLGTRSCVQVGDVGWLQGRRPSIRNAQMLDVNTYTYTLCTHGIKRERSLLYIYGKQLRHTSLYEEITQGPEPPDRPAPLIYFHRSAAA
jgi:hypothetical protein